MQNAVRNALSNVLLYIVSEPSLISEAPVDTVEQIYLKITTSMQLLVIVTVFTYHRSRQNAVCVCISYFS